MADLAPRAATDGLPLPLSLGGATLTALPETPRLSVAPFRGQVVPVSARLGAALPGVGEAHALPGGGRVFWAGLDQWFLESPQAGPALAASLAGLAAVTDQGDAWTGLSLQGPRAAEVLARLVPIDLHPDAFPPGRAARTELRHMMCALIAVPGGFDLLVMRSFTASAVHDLATAMRAVSARAALA